MISTLQMCSKTTFKFNNVFHMTYVIFLLLLDCVFTYCADEGCQFSTIVAQHLQNLNTDTGLKTIPHSPPQHCFLPVSCPHRKLSLRFDSEEEFLRSCRAKEKELEGIPCLYASLEPEAWAGPDDLIRVIKDRILDEQKKTVWVEQDLL